MPKASNGANYIQFKVKPAVGVVAAAATTCKQQPPLEPPANELDSAPGLVGRQANNSQAKDYNRNDYGEPIDNETCRTLVEIQRRENHSNAQLNSNNQDREKQTPSGTSRPVPSEPSRVGQQSKCCCHLSRNNISETSRLFKANNMKPNEFWDKYGNIRFIGIVFFILASCFCVYKLINMSDDDSINGDKFLLRHNLKLVSVFGRHGDRAPSDGFPQGDPTAQKVDTYWPNGASKLTDLGEFRQFKIGLELQRRYESFLDFEPNHYLAFSSPISRCQESLRHTLRGLFENEWSLEQGLRFIDQLQSYCIPSNSSKPTNSPTINSTNEFNYTNCQWLNNRLPSGIGSPKDWQKIAIDIKTIPALTYDYLNNCSYRLKNPTNVDKDLFNSSSVAKLEGSRKLAEILKTRYNQSFDYDAMVLWSTIAGEIRLIKTRESLSNGRHYFDWALKRLPDLFGSESNITLFDIYEQVSVFAYRDRLNGKEINQIQLGPLLSSLIQSQLVALKRADPPASWFLKANNLYNEKKLILYSSHDSILQLLMYRLNMIHSHENEGKTFKWRHQHCNLMSKKRSELDFNCYLTGLKMASYGMSVAFELWDVEGLKREREMNRPTANANNTDLNTDPSPIIINGRQYKTVKSLPYVRALLYYEEDARFRPVDYKLLQFGTMCHNWFKKVYPGESIDRFYDQDLRIDRQTSCPFELFSKLVSEYLVGREKLQQWCGFY